MGSRIQTCDGIILPRKEQQIAEEDCIPSIRRNSPPRKQKQKQKQKQNRSNEYDHEYDHEHDYEHDYKYGSHPDLLTSKPAAVSRRRSRHCRKYSAIGSSSSLYPRLSLLLLILALLDNPFPWLPFSLPSAQARPIMSVMCTAELVVGSISPFSQTVGIADFGHQLNHSSFLYSAILTTLPEEHGDLCDIGFLVDRDVPENETLADVPHSQFGLMIDLRGSCDVLTKASNALELQNNLYDNLNYILFYDSSPGKTVEAEIIPQLFLDDIWTMEPTSSPTMTESLAPTSEPSVSYKPSASSKPSAPPSASSKPSAPPSASFFPSVLPSLDPTTSTKPSQDPSTVPSSGPSLEPSLSLAPSSVPSFEPSEPPTLSSRPTATQDPTSRPTATQDPSCGPTESVTFFASTTSSAPSSSTTSSTASSFEDDFFVDTIFLDLDKSEDREQLHGGRDKDLKKSEKDRRAEERKRNRQKQLVESNDSIVFVSVAAINAERILEEVDSSRGSPEFFQTGNHLWDMKMSLENLYNPPRICSREDDSDDDVEYDHPDYSIPPLTRPTPIINTLVPVAAPSKNDDDDFFNINNDNDNGRISSGTYSKNAPGSFTIFKIVLFGLLISSPCLRALHLWWVGGGRIRFRRSSEDDSNRVIGLQYIPPMDNWFGGFELEEAPRSHARLTYQQIMNLPEIIYTTPVYSDEINHETKKASGSEESSSEENDICIHIQGDDRRDEGNATSDTIQSPLAISNSSTSATSPSTDGQAPSAEQIEDTDKYVNSESSFENEPTRLQLPTSPPRVSSTTQASITNGDGETPLSPRAIVPINDAPPDEEDQQQQPLLDTPIPTVPTPTQQQVQQQEDNPPPPPLSFRTQRRMRHFTTTTCTTCSICIDDFVEGEKVRLLPRCGHAFHTECILPWLRDRQGCCPLCKEGVLDDHNNGGGSGAANINGN